MFIEPDIIKYEPEPVNEVEFMTTKEKMIQAVNDLPNDASIEDAMERLLLLAKIERGLEQCDRGETLSHQDVKDRMTKWLK